MLVVLWFLMTGVTYCTARAPELNICELVKSPEQYDRKIIVLTGLVYADIHSTGIRGEECQEGVIIRYDVNSAPPGFVDGIEVKRGGLDARPFRVKVKGKFFARVKGPLGYLRRLEVTNVLDWQFIGQK